MSIVEKVAAAITVEAAEARIELRLVDRLKEIADQVSAISMRITGLEAKLDSKPGTWKLALAIGASVLTGFGAVITVLAFGGDRFDGGMTAAAALAEKQNEASQREQALNAKVDCLILKTGNSKAECK